MGNANVVEKNTLDTWLSAQQSITIFLINGIGLKGSLLGFDDTALILSSHHSGTQLVYKHAISTVCPEIEKS